MAKKIAVAYYIGDQELSGGVRDQLYNVLLPNGIRNNEYGITHTFDSTITRKTLLKNVPNVVLPKNPVAPPQFHEGPPPKESIAYAYV